MPAFAWLAFCSFAGAFQKQRARRSRRSSRPWRAEWDFHESICKYPPAPGFCQDEYKDPREAASNLQLSRRFLEANGGIVDDGSCPEANAEDKPKREVEECQAAAQSSVVSDAPNDHRHHRSTYNSST